MNYENQNFIQINDSIQNFLKQDEMESFYSDFQDFLYEFQDLEK